MRQFIEKLVWLAVVALVLYGAYSWYVGWWNPEDSFSRVRGYAENVFRMGGEQALEQAEQKADEYVDAVVGEVKEGAFEYAKDKVTDAFVTIGEEISGKAKSIFGIAPSSDTGAETAEEPKGAGFLVPPPSATLTIAPGTPIVFSINRGASYRVDWGSGTAESGTTSKDGITLLTHAWDKEGDYTVEIAVTDGGKTETKTFPIRVYK